MFLIVNLGSTFVYLVIMALSYIVLLALIPVSKFSLR